MDWIGHPEEESVRYWLEEAASGRYANDQRLDPYATSMRDFDDVTPHLRSLRAGSPPSTNDPRQRITDLRNAGLVEVGSEALSDLGDAVLESWERFGVDTNSIDDELARLLLLVLEARRLGEPSYLEFLSYWSDLRQNFAALDLIDSWDALYVLNYLDFRRGGYAPGDRYRSESVSVSEIEFDLDESFSQSSGSVRAAEGAERIARAIAGKVPRGRHRATFCEALEIVASSGASLEFCLQTFGIPERPRSWRILDGSRQDTIRSIVEQYGVLLPAPAETIIAVEGNDIGGVEIGTGDETVAGITGDKLVAASLVEAEPQTVILTLPSGLDFNQVQVGVPTRRPAQRPVTAGGRAGRKIDYQARQESNDAVGQLGEHFAMLYERWRLREHGKLRDEIVHVSRSDDSAGFDIRSFEVDGSDRFIEVKSTLGPAETQFFVSDAELRMARELGTSYVILRVFNLSSDPKCIEIRYPFDEVLTLRASVYAASFRSEE